MFKTFISSLIASVALGDSVGGEPWNYEKNGADWGGITGYELCDSGMKQSPINLADGLGMGSDKLAVTLGDYQDFSAAKVSIETKTIKVTAPTDVKMGNMDLTFADGNKSAFNAAQFHFHAPSEHQIYGNHVDLEMHVVHSYEDGSYGGVLGIFFDREKGGNGQNLFISQIESVFTNSGATTGAVSLKGFLQSMNTEDFWSYEGSLTTPPCSQGIKWTVFKEVQGISDVQLAKFTDQWANKADFAQGKGNNRVVQKFNGRTFHFSNFVVNGYKSSVLILGIFLFLSVIALCCVIGCICACPSCLRLQKAGK